MTTPLALPLGPRTIIRFTGPDALRYLNGQVTQDIRPLANSNNSALTCVTDAKGRVGALARIISDGPQAWYVEAPRTDDSSLYDRLTRYLIADDAEAADASGSWHIIHFADTPPGDIPGSLIRMSDRFGPVGYDLWLPAAETEQLSREFAPSDISCRELFETRRIEAKIPEWGVDITQDLFPAELGLERTAVSFTKGCYIGQEVISRMKYSGKINRRLTRLSMDPTIPKDQLTGASLCLPGNHSGEKAGSITSIAPYLSEDGRRAGLSMVGRLWLDANEFDIITSDGSRHVSAAKVPGEA